MVNINCKNIDLFKYKFNREPKQWSIEDVHKLWLKTKERDKKYRDIYLNIIDEINNVIPGDKKDVYYYDDNNRLMKYSLFFDKRFKSWLVSKSVVSLKNREEKLNFFLANNQNIELGQKIYNANKFTSGRLRYVSFYILNKLVSDELRKKFKSLDIEPPISFTIKLNDIEYIVNTLNDNYHTSYYEFNIASEKVLIEI